jgi:hypothetical protein
MEKIYRQQVWYGDQIFLRDMPRLSVDIDLTYLPIEDRETSLKHIAPDWSIYNCQRFPAINWKLQNLQNLRNENPDKHREQYEILKRN